MPDFDFVYINLDSATGRRQALERSFAEAGFSPRWKFTRLSAVDIHSPLVKDKPGAQSGPYKGNYFSHLSCVGHYIDSPNHLYVSEDDQLFCNKTGPLAEAVIDALPEDGWDVVFPELTLLSAAHYPLFYKMATAVAAQGQVRLLDLAPFPFPYVGSSAYIVNARSKRRFFQALAPTERMDHPYDICLRASILSGALRGYLCFPFLTSPSEYAHESQAPYGHADRADVSLDEKRIWQYQLDMLWLFKRFVWVGATDENVAAAFRNFHGLMSMSERDQRFIELFGQMFSLQRNIDYNDHQMLTFHTVGARY